MRFENWKIVFAEQRCQGTLRIWAEPFTELRVPKLFNLRTDPFEYADITSNTYYDWFMRRDYFVFYATAMCSGSSTRSRSSRPGTHRPASASTRSSRSWKTSWRATRCWTRGTTAREVGDRRLRRACDRDGGRIRPPEARVAVFDNDGTLWCEKPAYIQLDFLVRRLAEGLRRLVVAEQRP